MVGQLVLLELAVRSLAGSPGQAADCEEALVAAKAVQEGVGVAFAEGELHNAGAEHRFSRVAWVAAMLVRRFELLDKSGSARRYPLYNGFEEAVAVFRGLFRLSGAIKIEIAHEDFPV